MRESLVYIDESSTLEASNRPYHAEGGIGHDSEHTTTRFREYGLTRRGYVVFGVAFALTLLALVLGGCSQPVSTSLSEAANDSQFSLQNQARYRVDDNGPVVDLATPTAPPTITQADAAGIWQATTGEGATINLPQFGQIWSPNDSRMRGVVIYGPEGNKLFEAAELDVNVSNQAGIWAAQYAVVRDAIVAMNQAEATRYVESLEAAGEITSDLAELIRDVYVPTLPAE